MHLVPSFIAAFVIYAATTPYLPILVRGLGYRPVVVGILLGIFEGAGIIGPFIFGHFADKLGKYKSGLIVTFVLSVIAIIPLVLWIHPLLSALFLVLFAIGFRSTVPLLDAITTINLGASGNYGKIRTMGSLSFVVMVLFFQWTPVLRPNTSINIALWIGATSALAIIPVFLLPTRYTETAKARVHTGRIQGAQKSGLWLPLLVPGIGMIAMSRLAISPIYSFFPLYLVEYMNWDVVGLLFALASASEIPCMFISNRLIRRFGPLRLLMIAAIAIGIRLSILAFFPYRFAIVASQMLHSLCFGLFHPAAVAFISNCVPPERRAMGMSIYLSIGTGLPALLGNILGGYLVDHWGYRVFFGTFALFTLPAIGLYFFISHYRSIRTE
ncbi:MAG: MFS transporter [Spirochaetaceae bacterium]|jgi:PPP family 3-phenylpropionic acid transporter|nr:MFS transporter [Spirochaetaceae bacterium]